MARSRNIKPGLFLNEDLVEIAYEYRLLFIGLWTLADRDGRLEDRPKKIKMNLFPADDVDIDKGLSELGRYNFVLRYEVDNIKYIQILNFLKHQKPHHQEKKSEIPPPNLSGEGSSQHRTNPSDSLNTDSLNTDSLNLGQAREVLDFLNQITGRNYQPTETNLKFLRARFKEGYTPEILTSVIEDKAKEWMGTENEKYLRPATLFNAEKFNQYAGQIGMEKQHGTNWKPSKHEQAISTTSRILEQALDEENLDSGAV
jgi:uncharacterized phage protein (TIGR02220 family)